MIVRRQDATGGEIDTNTMFRGTVLRQVLIGDDDAPMQRVTAVEFRDGARNTWHSHSCEQVLVITHGEGIVATEAEERQVTAGDVVLIDPNELHWHGAQSGKDMTHLSILMPSTMTILDAE